MSELDENTRRRYLKEMGITVWSLRDTVPVPEMPAAAAAVQSETVVPEAEKRHICFITSSRPAGCLSGAGTGHTVLSFRFAAARSVFRQFAATVIFP